jgi:hypothetical protein
MMRALLGLMLLGSTALAEIPVTIVFKKEQPCWEARKALRMTSFAVECKSLTESRFAFGTVYLGTMPVSRALAQVRKIKGVESAQVARELPRRASMPRQ